MNLKIVCDKVSILVFVLLFSCTKNPKGDDFKDYFSQTDIVNVFGEEISLKVEGNPLSFMFNMSFFDSQILVNEFPDREYTYKLINLRDHSVRPFGKKGEGPNELLSDGFSFSFDHENASLYLSDNIHYYVFNIEDVKNGVQEPNDRFTINQQDERFMGSTVHANGYIVGSMYHKRFGVYNIENKKFFNKEEYEGGPSMALANQAFYINHPTKKKAVYCMSKVPEFGIIEILEPDIEIIKYSWGETKLGVENGDGTMAVMENDEVKFEFMSAAVSEDFIFILYSGEMPADRTREARVKAALTNTIYVLDWNGKPIKRYQTDRYLRSIAIDGNTNTLYGSTYEENPGLISYKLNDIE